MKRNRLGSCTCPFQIRGYNSIKVLRCQGLTQSSSLALAQGIERNIRLACEATLRVIYCFAMANYDEVLFNIQSVMEQVTQVIVEKHTLGIERSPRMLEIGPERIKCSQLFSSSAMHLAPMGSPLIALEYFFNVVEI